MNRLLPRTNPITKMFEIGFMVSFLFLHLSVLAFLFEANNFITQNPVFSVALPAFLSILCYYLFHLNSKADRIIAEFHELTEQNK